MVRFGHGDMAAECRSRAGRGKEIDSGGGSAADPASFNAVLLGRDWLRGVATIRKGASALCRGRESISAAWLGELAGRDEALRIGRNVSAQMKDGCAAYPHVTPARAGAVSCGCRWRAVPHALRTEAVCPAAVQECGWELTAVPKAALRRPSAWEPSG